MNDSIALYAILNSARIHNSLTTRDVIIHCQLMVMDDDYLVKYQFSGVRLRYGFWVTPASLLEINEIW